MKTDRKSIYAYRKPEKFAGPWPKGVLRSRGLVLYVLVDLPLPPPQGAFSAVVGRR